MRWFQAIMPKEEGFYVLFNRHAATLVEGAEALRDLFHGTASVEACCKRVMAHEEAADDITREVLLAVRRTFITPFDRSDIKDLTTSLDDAIDQMQKTAKTVTLYGVDRFEPAMTELADLILATAKLTVEAVGLLSGMRANAARLNSLAEEITRIEDASDAVYDRGRKALYLAHREGDAVGFVVGLEIYDHLEKVVDRFEDVANRISGIVIEQV